MIPPPTHDSSSSSCPCLACCVAGLQAEVERLRGLLHAEQIADMHYCELHEMAFMCGEGATPRCPHCRITELEDRLEPEHLESRTPVVIIAGDKAGKTGWVVGTGVEPGTYGISIDGGPYPTWFKRSELSTRTAHYARTIAAEPRNGDSEDTAMAKQMVRLYESAPDKVAFMIGLLSKISK